MDEPLFPVVCFHTVFDTEPEPEVLALPELVRALRRFELKPELDAQIERELARVRRAASLVEAGSAADGPLARRLLQAQADARSAGRDPAEAVRAEAARLETEARKEAKKGLRTWSPALYRPGARRGSEGVLALSCLVLDYDAGVEPDEAQSTWEPWFHLLHGTWSHQPAHPRFRVVLPLARLVAAADWAAVWKWAAAQAGPVDPALKGVAAAFALPAIGGPERELLCRVHSGELLDPEAEGLALRPFTAELAPKQAEKGMMRRDKAVREG